MKQKIVLATGNKGKVKEMADVLANFGFEVIAQTDLGIESPEETGLTFVENAILKARYAAEKSGLPAIADDSGLVVDALNGAPGLYSARYAGVDGDEADAKNREKLLTELSDVPSERRQAKFVSTIVLLQHPSDPSPIIAQGECDGKIIYEEKGENGFGYDSLFFSPEKGCTFAELETVEKNKMIITTTPNIEGKQIVEYKQVVFGEVIAGANFMRDFFAGITDVIGGRSSVYERRISRARQDALKELEEKAIALGANAVVGVEINYATVSNKSMFMVIASGTAVVVR